MNSSLLTKNSLWILLGLGNLVLKIKGKNTNILIDPFEPDFTGLKLPKDLESQVVLITHQHQDHNYIQAVSGNPMVIAGPGEYEVKGITVVGIQVFHDSKQGQERGKDTLYHLIIDGVDIVHAGDLGHILTDDQASQISNTDILMVPVGGHFSLDGETASKLVAQLEPKIVIPMHYNLPGLKFDLDPVDKFLSEMGVENQEPVSKLSITKDKLPEETTVVVLSKA